MYSKNKAKTFNTSFLKKKRHSNLEKVDDLGSSDLHELEMCISTQPTCVFLYVKKNHNINVYHILEHKYLSQQPTHCLS